MSKVEIGSKYDGPSWDKPCIRQMPRHWRLEESKSDYRPRWYRRVEVWTIIIAVLWLLAGAAQLGVGK